MNDPEFVGAAHTAQLFIERVTQDDPSLIGSWLRSADRAEGQEVSFETVRKKRVYIAAVDIPSGGGSRIIRRYQVRIS